MLTFEPVINIGNLITIGLAFIAVVGAWYKVRGHLDIIEYRVEAIEKTLETLGDVLKSLADTDKAMALLEQRQTAVETLAATLGKEVSDLRRGIGFVRGQSGIEHEYR